MNRLLAISGVAACAVVLAAGGCRNTRGSAIGDRLERSVTPPLIRPVGISGLDIRTLISSDDTLGQSPGYRFGGTADGMGMISNPDGTFTILVNHEDNYAVSRLYLDSDFRPVRGEYVVNSDQGRFRRCSATMATPEIHGFGPLFLTAGETDEESLVMAVDPRGPVGQSNMKPALGHWEAENAVPLPRTAYEGRTVILIGDDDLGPTGGQLAMYSSTVGDLDNGALHVLARTDDNIRERDMKPGVRYPILFRRIENQKELTGAQIDRRTLELKAVRFGRIEDIDYRKEIGEGREVYFNATGQDTRDDNADHSRTKYGRTYRLVLDPADPTRGTLEVLLDGDDRTGVARMFQNVDNICATRNYLYLQEDANGYGDETHDSYIYQYEIGTGTLRPVLELDHRRGDPYYGGNSRFGSWEYGAMIDISSEVEHANTFAIAVQPHTWTGPRYRNPDGGSLRPNESQASQIIIVRGLPK